MYQNNQVGKEKSRHYAPPPQKLTGFEFPRPAKDLRQQKLYEKYNLPEAPSLQVVEPTVKELLKNPKTLDDAIQLVLGRELDPKDPSDLKAITTLALSGDVDAKLGLLLVMKTVDESKAKQKNKK